VKKRNLFFSKSQQKKEDQEKKGMRIRLLKLYFRSIAGDQNGDKAENYLYKYNK